MKINREIRRHSQCHIQYCDPQGRRAPHSSVWGSSGDEISGALGQRANLPRVNCPPLLNHQTDFLPFFIDLPLEPYLVKRKKGASQCKLAPIGSLLVWVVNHTASHKSIRAPSLVYPHIPNRYGVEILKGFL